MAFALSLGEDRLFGARHGAVAALQRLSRALGAALQHEERRTGWVSREVRGICRVRDAFLAAQEGAARPTILDLAEVLLEASALCAQLADVYRRVRLCGAAQVLLNGWTALSLSLWAPDVPPHPALRPYMGLMLTDHDLADVAPRGSPALNTLLRACHPTKSFLDLVHETGLPLAHVYRLASHLAYWRAALIILPIRRDSVYTVAPRPRVPVFTLEDTLALKYRTDCPISPPLIEMLRCFTPTVNKGLFLGYVPFLGTINTFTSLASFCRILNLWRIPFASCQERHYRHRHCAPATAKNTDTAALHQHAGHTDRRVCTGRVVDACPRTPRPAPAPRLRVPRQPQERRRQVSC